MKFSLEGKVVVVTGATSGIGKSAAVELAKQGAKVVVSGRRAPEGEAVVAQIVADGGEAVFIRADVSSEADVQALFESTVKQFGKLDSVFLNSGVFNFASIEDQQGADLAHQLNVNVQGVFYGLQQASKHLNKGGSILVNTSVVAERTMPNALAYSLTKAAANSLVRSAAIELAPRSIRVNAVAPGPIFTEGSSAMAGGREGVDAYMAPMVPLGRVGEPIEIAAAVVFLTSDEASFITGQILGVDGGIGAK